MRAPVTAALATLAALAVLSASALARGDWLGGGTADVWGHAWGYAWTARALGAGGWPLVAPLDGGQRWWLVDPPVALAAAPVAAVFGPKAAWNLVQLALPALVAASFADALGRWRGGDPGGRAAFGVALGLSPFARGAVASGVPEAHAVLFLPWLAAAAATGASPWVVALAALALATSGPYAPVGGVVVAVAWLVARRPIGGSGVAAAIGGGAGAAIQLAGLAWAGHPALAGGGGGVANPGATWAWAARGGADVANYLVPRLLLPPPDGQTLHRHAAWVGLTAVGLAAARGDRAARGLLAVGGAALVLSLGAHLRGLGVDTGIPLPAALVPGLGANAYRLAGLAAACALAAAWAAAGARARPWAVVIVLEGLLLAPIEATVPGAPDPTGPIDAWLAAHPGAVVDLPLDREGRLPKGPCPQVGFAHQAAHGQPIASALYRAPAALSVPPIASIDEAIARAARADRAWARPENPPRVGESRPGAPFAANRSDRDRLRGLGYVWLTFDARCVPPEARGSARATLDRWLGAPVATFGDTAVWAL